MDLPGLLSDGLAKLAYVHDRHGKGLAKALAHVCTTLHLEQVEVTPAAGNATAAASAGAAAAGGGSKDDSKTDNKKRKRDEEEDEDDDEEQPLIKRKASMAGKSPAQSNAAFGNKTKDASNKAKKQAAEVKPKTQDVLRAVAPVQDVLRVLWRAMWSELLSDGSHREQEIELPSELKDISNMVKWLDDPILEKW